MDKRHRIRAARRKPRDNPSIEIGSPTFASAPPPAIALFLTEAGIPQLKPTRPVARPSDEAPERAAPGRWRRVGVGESSWRLWLIIVHCYSMAYGFSAPRANRLTPRVLRAWRNTG